MPTPMKPHACQHAFDDVPRQHAQPTSPVPCASQLPAPAGRLYEVPGHVSPYTRGVACRVSSPIAYVGPVLACRDAWEVRVVLQSAQRVTRRYAAWVARPALEVLRSQPSSVPSSPGPNFRPSFCRGRLWVTHQYSAFPVPIPYADSRGPASRPAHAWISGRLPDHRSSASAGHSVPSGPNAGDLHPSGQFVAGRLNS